MNRQWSGNVGTYAAQLGDRLGRQNLRRNRNDSCWRVVTDPRVGNHRRRSIVEGKVRQRHLGQNQDDGEERQFEYQDRKYPAPHSSELSQVRITPPRARCQLRTLQCSTPV